MSISYGCFYRVNLMREGDKKKTRPKFNLENKTKYEPGEEIIKK